MPESQLPNAQERSKGNGARPKPRANIGLLKRFDLCKFTLIQQLGVLQWALPLLLLCLVLADEIYEHILLEQKSLLSGIFWEEVFFFGALGAALVWFTLWWVRKACDEREQNHRRLQKMYTALTAAQKRLNVLHRQRGDLLNRMIQLQEEDRRRLSREIHDELGQLLTGLSLHLKACQHVVPQNLEQAQAHLAGASALVQQTLEETRKIIAGIRPATLDEQGLLPALQEELQRRLRPLDVEVKFVFQGELSHVDSGIAATILGITQEAVTNIIRHAYATQVTLDIEESSDGILVRIIDNGIGADEVSPEQVAFDQPSLNVNLDTVVSSADEPVSAAGADAPRRSFGILGMQERAKAVGGWLDVTPNQPNGMEVRFWLPFPSNNKNADVPEINQSQHTSSAASGAEDSGTGISGPASGDEPYTSNEKMLI